GLGLPLVLGDGFARQNDGLVSRRRTVVAIAITLALGSTMLRFGRPAFLGRCGTGELGFREAATTASAAAPASPGTRAAVRTGGLGRSRLRFGRSPSSAPPSKTNGSAASADSTAPEAVCTNSS